MLKAFYFLNDLWWTTHLIFWMGPRRYFVNNYIYSFSCYYTCLNFFLAAWSCMVPKFIFTFATVINSLWCRIFSFFLCFAKVIYFCSLLQSQDIYFPKPHVPNPSWKSNECPLKGIDRFSTDRLCLGLQCCIIYG